MSLRETNIWANVGVAKISAVYFRKLVTQPNNNCCR